jgi:hypothetical protein
VSTVLPLTVTKGWRHALADEGMVPVVRPCGEYDLALVPEPAA